VLLLTPYINQLRQEKMRSKQYYKGMSSIAVPTSIRYHAVLVALVPTLVIMFNDAGNVRSSSTYYSFPTKLRHKHRD
jgi:hypothetical protein